ncbi:MAG: hypothetical protein JNM70_14490 [Anaerolineae bacterium]|nr:hypothetical protein [Anaerolineae bacterium]
MNTILVQMSEKAWTMQALHLACALARNSTAKLVLARLIEVQHYSYLGTPFGNSDPTPQEYDDIQEYAATAEDYGVELTVRMMQCANPLEAMADAADHLDSAVVFAHIPSSRIPYWAEIQTWLLKRRLAAGQRQLFTLARPPQPETYAPSITVEPAHTPPHSQHAGLPKS